MEQHPKIRSGIAMGACAILLWSMAAPATIFGGTEMGVWQFLALAGGIGGLVQLIFCLFFLKMPARSLLLPPLRFWPLIFLGFLLYLILFNNAVVMAAGPRVVGVALMNYLWPTLTVLMAVMWVPGTKASWRLLAATLLSFSGLVVANWHEISDQFLAGRSGGGQSVSVLPYVLSGLAAVSWAAYSALTARWRSWACNYAASPIGFLLVAIFSAGVCVCQGHWTPMTWQNTLAVCVGGLGPYAGGYLLWELSLHRAPAGTLGIMASATPILATLSLCAMFAICPQMAPPLSNYPLFLSGAALIALAVLIGSYRRIATGNPASPRLRRASGQ